MITLSPEEEKLVREVGPIDDNILKRGFQQIFLKDWYGNQGELWNCVTCSSNCCTGPGCLHCPLHRMNMYLLSLGDTRRERAKFFHELLRMPVDKWRSPRLIFVCLHGDLFHPDIPTINIAQMFAVMAMRPDHVFIVLTKRALRLEQLLGSADFRKLVLEEGHKLFGDGFSLGNAWGANVLVGVSAENQSCMDQRAMALTRIPETFGRVLFVSPLLAMTIIPEEVLRCLDWIVCCREVGWGHCKARPCKDEWIRSIADQSFGADIPFFLEDRPSKDEFSEFGFIPRQYPPILARR